ncbi:MAG: hypothetical protein EON58_08260 [Alphaproteobacteria bacterium]|nr:MAG: hypothetical protein EON58_08260 [Alphaproteobacteria bacterium]
MNHLAAAVEKSLTSGNHYGALVVALTLPDVCGWVEGRHARSKDRYISFFNDHMSVHYCRPVGPARTLTTFLTGDDFYALRCSVVHEGRDDISSQKARQTLENFQFVVPPDGWVIHRNLHNARTLQLQVDLFCREILTGVYSFLGGVQPGSPAADRLYLLGRIHDMNGVAL